MSLLEKLSEWILQKEEELAKNCAIPIEEIDKQIEKIKQEKAEVQKKYEETMAKLDHLLERLEKIKEMELNCKRD